jgi:hypothetical protein
VKKTMPDAFGVPGHAEPGTGAAATNVGFRAYSGFCQAPSMMEPGITQKG